MIKLPSAFSLQACAIAVVVAFLAGSGSGFWAGWEIRSAGVLRAEKAALKGQVKEARKVVAAQGKAAKAATSAGIRAEKAQTKIRIVYRDIVKEVPVYVTPQADRLYLLPHGFVRVHDAAARGVDPATLPPAAGQPDDAPSGVALSTAAGVIAENYGAAQACRQQVLDLQAWIVTLEGLWNEKPR